MTLVKLKISGKEEAAPMLETVRVQMPRMFTAAFAPSGEGGRFRTMSLKLFPSEAERRSYNLNILNRSGSLRSFGTSSGMKVTEPAWPTLSSLCPVFDKFSGGGGFVSTFLVEEHQEDPDRGIRKLKLRMQRRSCADQRCRISSG